MIVKLILKAAAAEYFFPIKAKLPEQFSSQAVAFNYPVQYSWESLLSVVTRMNYITETTHASDILYKSAAAFSTLRDVLGHLLETISRLNREGKAKGKKLQRENSALLKSC